MTTAGENIHADLIRALGAMSRCLCDDGQTTRYEFLDAIVFGLQLGDEPDWGYLAGVDFWGGSGSFFDIRFHNFGSRLSSETQRLSHDYFRSMTSLLEVIHRKGLTVYRDESRSHLLSKYMA